MGENVNEAVTVYKDPDGNVITRAQFLEYQRAGDTMTLDDADAATNATED